MFVTFFRQSVLVNSHEYNIQQSKMSKDIQADMAQANNSSYTVVKKAVKILTEKICKEVRIDGLWFLD